MLQSLVYLIVSFLASVAGAICGIGGGVIIKPVLDLCALASVSTISFLSGCTVLSMSCYSVGRNLLSGSSKVDLKTGTPLAIGAAVGGVAGKQLFSAIRALFADPNTVGAVQAGCLAIITAGTLHHIQKQDQNPHCKKRRSLREHRAGAGGHVQLSGHRRRTHQLGGIVLLFWHGHQNRRSKQSVHHPVLSNRQPAHHFGYPERAGIFVERPGAYDMRRHRRRHGGSGGEQANG